MVRVFVKIFKSGRKTVLMWLPRQDASVRHFQCLLISIFLHLIQPLRLLQRIIQKRSLTELNDLLRSSMARSKTEKIIQSNNFSIEISFSFLFNQLVSKRPSVDVFRLFLLKFRCSSQEFFYLTTLMTAEHFSIN